MRKFVLPTILLFGSLVFAQESVQEIRRQIKAVEKETVQEKQLYQTEKKRHQDYVENAKKKLVSMDEQAAQLRAQIDSLRAESSRLDKARQQASGTTKWIDAKKAKYQESLARSIDELVPILESDFPFGNTEAMESMKEAASQLRKVIITPDEALGRAYDLLLDRIQVGYTTETWSGYFPWQGRSIAGKYVRYGAVASIFVSQDNEEIFWLLKGNAGYEWKAVGADLALRAMLKETLKVAEGKSPPALVMLPFPTAKEVVK
jgi:hypothetical protein